MLLIVVAWRYAGGIREVTQPKMFATVAPILADEAIRAYETGASGGFARFSQGNVDDEKRQLYLLDSSYKDVLHRHISDDGIRVAHLTRTGHLSLLRNHIAGYRVISSTGHEYIFLLYINTGLREARGVISGSMPLFLFLPPVP